MEIKGGTLIGGEMDGGESTAGGTTFRAVDPASGAELEPAFREADTGDVDRAVAAAAAAFESYAALEPSRRAAFLRAVADAIEGLGAPLIDRASAETGLPSGRLEGERARTTGQLRLFAEVVADGSWVEARIDPGDPSRQPARPDVRRMLVPLGPVAVFGASNFPLAFSVAGGDTASALAAGCPVVFKAHPGHPGTAELTARAVLRAARETGVPEGVFSLVHGWSHEPGLALVRHPAIRAVAFTGSLRAGRALFDAGAARPDPIPVYAEMGSVNPLFLLPSAVAERGDAIAEGLAGSITLGVGQFCTNPGVVLGVGGSGFDRLGDRLAERLRGAEPGVMLYARLREGYDEGVARARDRGARSLTDPAVTGPGDADARPALLATEAARLIEDPALREEVFGPASLLVAADDAGDLERVAEALEGQLTASIHGTETELIEHQRLVEILTRKAGRLIFNGYPTGVEVGHAMQHGGPYPASTDSRTTSVGTAAITRFARPVCWHEFPEAALPPELCDANERGIWRLVDGSPTRADVGTA
ncbi:MAG: aldehyde dehydrogenase (NADP(+)) [Gemmatimonadota bacterium]